MKVPDHHRTHTFCRTATSLAAVLVAAMLGACSTQSSAAQKSLCSASSSSSSITVCVTLDQSHTVGVNPWIVDVPYKTAPTITWKSGTAGATVTGIKLCSGGFSIPATNGMVTLTDDNTSSGSAPVYSEYQVSITDGTQTYSSPDCATRASRPIIHNQ